MAENKEFESVDEIFRKTFDALNDAPSNSGWDTPSDRVWQQVQTGIGQKNNGWTTGKMLAAAAITLVVAASLYITFKAQNPAVETPNVPATPTETPAVANSPETVTAPAASPEKTVLPAVKEKKKITPAKSLPGSSATTPELPSNPQDVSTEAQTEKTGTQPAAQQPKNTVKPPNSVERNRLKEKSKEKQDTTQH
jgi:hypothetical protein